MKGKWSVRRLDPGQSANYPTYFFDRTTIEVDKNTDYGGWVEFSAWGSPPDYKAVPAYGKIYETQGWVGFNVNVKNLSPQPTILHAYNVGGP